ncbi:family 16 glycosylhydrolase [Belnapia sp. T18]|uniref:Family 16 glycosylhydrolase n=1 Tax=Belnapia arida TaxID=2804533 RepID=A0ABS1U126_9PROT|nr:family 16 glycosylhydrolase [Belnapia arida]MBL6078376.1 family 16 glycosylhydrolase [Belnapia arida]
MANNPLSVSFDNGFGSLGNAWNVPAPRNGEVTLSGSSGLMQWASGKAAGHGYGTYTVTAKIEGHEPGPAILLWPGNDQWPGQEIDLVENAHDHSGRQYGTVHWNDNGKDAFKTEMFEGVKGGVFHDYQLIWEPGKMTFKVDGKDMGSITSHIPKDFDHGGMNNTIGVLNNNPDTSITVSHIDFKPLGSSAPAPAPAPAPTPEAAPAPAPSTGSGGSSNGGGTSSGGAVDWNTIAAQVLANFNATGKWEMPSGDASHSPAPAPAPSHDQPVDWHALAAQATANFEATGHWFI